MAGIGRTLRGSWVLVLLPMLWAGQGAAATIFADTSSSEVLIYDARLTLPSLPSDAARAESRDADFLAAAGHTAEVAQCVITAAGTAAAVAPGTGFVWGVRLCLAATERKPFPTLPRRSIGLASLGPLQPAAAQFALGQEGGRTRLGSSLRIHRLGPAPIPLPGGGAALLGALGALALFRRRRG